MVPDRVRGRDGANAQIPRTRLGRAHRHRQNGPDPARPVKSKAQACRWISGIPATNIFNMNLDEAQRQRVTAWILEGAKLSEIQSRLAAEFSLRLTYMEVRLLVD